MIDILKQRKEKLQRAYKANPQLATYARLREVTLLLNKLYQHDAARSKKDSGSTEGRDSAQLLNDKPSPSANGGWRKRQINNLKKGE